MGQGARRLEPPPVERVRPGIWSIPVPIPDNPLGYTLVYLLESDRGAVLVDTGWDDPATLDALSKGMVDAGYGIRDCYGVLSTHHHPDHHGLAGQVRELSGAWVAMHPADAEVVTKRITSHDSWFMHTAAVLLEAGASEEDLAALPPADELRNRKAPPPAVPNRLVADGDRVDVPGWDVAAVWTPGHTPGHLCFAVDLTARSPAVLLDTTARSPAALLDTTARSPAALLDSERLLLSGDHVLPRISPHIGLMREDDDADPLGDYLASLRKLLDLDVGEVLPAHEHRFTGLDARIRVLVEHHEARLRSIREQLAGGPATAWDIAMRMPWNRTWDELGPIMKRSALMEAQAHLRHLVATGALAVDASVRPFRYLLADG